MVERTEASRIEAGVETLGEAGFWVSPGILRPDLVTSLLAEQRRREEAGEFGAARVARGGERADGGGHRHARSSWFDGHSDAERQFLGFADRLRLGINRRLMLGLFDFEAQFLHYPPGGFYRRHVDALHGERGRVVSVIAYLNTGWTTQDGGALAIWAAGDGGEPVAEVMPVAGTVVVLLSEDIPHEARVARRERRAIAGWFSLSPSSTR